MAKVYAVWHGGINYAEPIIPMDVEQFPSMDAAARALSERAVVGYWQRQTFDYVNREQDVTYTPNADEDCEMRLFLADPSEEIDPIPDYALTIGPRGGIRRV